MNANGRKRLGKGRRSVIESVKHENPEGSHSEHHVHTIVMVAPVQKDAGNLHRSVEDGSIHHKPITLNGWGSHACTPLAHGIGNTKK